jgi:GntR family transcriptional repressor for pyruvate dehydrogenase complex
MEQQDGAPTDQIFIVMEREEPLASRVAREIERLILKNDLAVGTRLPSERELAGQFAVSRTVIREAVRTLVAKGFLEVKTGSGTIVRQPTSASAAESMSRLLAAGSDRFDYGHVSEVRRLLEVEIAGLAAQRRTNADLDTLKGILAQAAERIDDPETFVQTDVAFHEALAYATHNDLFVIILSSIAQTMIDVRRLGLRVSGTPARALDYHHRILTSIETGDTRGAREAMDQHMDEARQTMVAALATDTASSP